MRAEERSEGRWRRSATGLALAAAITVGMVLSCFADPAETTPETAARNPDYAAAQQALERKDWREAVRRFSQAALHDPDNADLHNYLGFSYRNLGELDAAFKHYRRALELNPRHRGAHEYAGEAYLMLGDLARAEEHLAALRRICLLPCEELADLERVIAAYRKRTGTGRSP
ncbi:MAG: tetratricopeptide repeat protein [Candidatus Entotheonellia bacterium]